MSEQKTHYRKLCPTNFLGAHDLDGRDINVTIAKVHNEELMNIESHQKETKTVIEFEKASKPWVANITNLKAIAKIHGDYVEDWVGKKITLFPTKTKSFGDIVDCVRVRGASGSTTLKPADDKGL